MTLLSIDIGGTAIKYALVNEEGIILEKNSVKNERIDLNSLLDALYEIIENHLDKIEGVALSIPAMVNPKTGEILSEGSMPFLIKENLADLIKNKYNISVSSENDGNCAALAEVWKGIAKECNDIALVVVGTGIGGAIIKDKKIHHGKNFVSGEFGYFISDFDFEKNSFKIWSEKGATYTLIKNMSKLKGKELSGEEVFDLAGLGDEDAIREIKLFYNNNAVGIFNLQYLFDPEMVVFGGGISKRPDFLERLNSDLDRIYKVIHHAPIRPNIKVAKYGNDANLIGAVYNFLQVNFKTNI